ncbi:hypothetical protein L1987_49735 [Smallanthus sonchifolius]|uniref:Uncharacterized protein n=1 Tax=Smallanthus sonchifolius TaxID=185202 RepID=A0ACB9FWK7_9ASTR|nr:hypothetical protein L1987_49735 [Smallanthus sonchifolius]
MDTIRSFKGYGKVDPVEEQAFRRKARKRLIILIISIVLLLAIIIGAVVGTLIHNRNGNNSLVQGSNSSAQSIKAVCSQTLYPESCYNNISKINKSNSTDPEELLKLSLQVVFNSLSELSSLPQNALEEINSTFFADTKSRMQNSTEYASNSLAIVSYIAGILGKLNIPVHRKLLTETGHDFPEWVSPNVRRLLQDSRRPTPNVTVAIDGTGDVKTIKEAMAKIGFYTSVTGKGFVAIDMGFKNTAGAVKHQAVALRSSSDLSVFYKCSFDAFQDTLYPHSGRQFYRDCDVIGTVDFIFGSAAVVFQNCRIMPRQPLPNQFVTITAQGKKDPNENSGISIQNCDISAFDNLTARTYLGRPWKKYSTTVIMQSTIGGFLNPLGWISWVQGVDPPSTIFYGEYMNTGPGAGVDNRVKWAGYKPRLTSNDASRFTVASFIQGQRWLPQTNVLFDSTL